MKKFFLLMPILMMLSACAPQRLQSAQLVDYNEGRPVYALTGYTDAGDTASGASVKYIEYSLAKSCPDGIEIISMNEQESHNGCCKFLYWTAKAECN